MYANKQNLERLKSTVQQEAELLSNINLKTSATTNILICNAFKIFNLIIIFFFLAKTEPCLNFKEIPTVRPVTVIPQRRKRRRITYSHVKNEPFQFGDTAQQTPQINNDLNESQISSSDSLTSSASPIQELGYMENLFPYIDDIFEDEKIKLIEDFPSIDDINDVFGINNNQQFPLLTPTMSALVFFA
jgi:hypothetical protein